MLMYDVENLYEFIKEELINNLMSKEISVMEGEHLTIFHMHGLAGFYGPKILIKLNDNSVDFKFKIFSLLSNDISFQFDSNDYSLHLYSRLDLDIDNIKTFSSLIKEDILELIDTYIKIFKTIVVNKDSISSEIFYLANYAEGELIFNKVSLPINNEYRDYRIAIKENNVYIDDLFSEGYFPSKSHFPSVAEEIYKKFLSEYLIEEINWYQLKKEESFIKVEKLAKDGSSISFVSFDKKFISEFLFNFLKANISLRDRI